MVHACEKTNPSVFHLSTVSLRVADVCVSIVKYCIPLTIGSFISAFHAEITTNYRLIMPPPLIDGVKRCFCLTSVCLSVAYIGRKSRRERSRKTKIATEVAPVTRDSDTKGSKGQRARSPGRFIQRGLNA